MPQLPNSHPARVILAFVMTTVFIGIIPLIILWGVTAAVGYPDIDPTPDLSTRSITVNNQTQDLKTRVEDLQSLMPRGWEFPIQCSLVTESQIGYPICQIGYQYDSEINIYALSIWDAWCNQIVFQDGIPSTTLGFSLGSAWTWLANLSLTLQTPWLAASVEYDNIISPGIDVTFQEIPGYPNLVYAMLPFQCPKADTSTRSIESTYSETQDLDTRTEEAHRLIPRGQLDDLCSGLLNQISKKDSQCFFGYHWNSDSYLYDVEVLNWNCEPVSSNYSIDYVHQSGVLYSAQVPYSVKWTLDGNPLHSPTVAYAGGQGGTTVTASGNYDQWTLTQFDCSKDLPTDS